MQGYREAIDAYLDFLRNGFEEIKRGRHEVLITPFTDPSGDCIEIRSLLDSERNLVLGDCGTAYDYLYMRGINPLGARTTRLDILNEILANNGCFLKNGEVQVVVRPGEDLGQAMHRLIQSLLNLTDLVYLSRVQGPQTFKAEVEEYLNSHDVRFSRDETLQGYSRTNKFDFVVRRAERITAIRALSTKNPGYAKRIAVDTAFAILDVQKVQPAFRGVPLLDDSEGSNVWAGEPYSVLEKYAEQVVMWPSQKDLLLSLVA